MESKLNKNAARTDKINMQTLESLSKLYQTLEPHFGPEEARKTVSLILANAISDLQDQNLPITESSISNSLIKYADDFKFAAEKDVA